MTSPGGAPRTSHPVVTQQVVVAAITLALGQAVAFGVIPAATSSKVASAAPILVGVAFAVFAAAHSVAAVFSARKVTPTANPRAVVTAADGTATMQPLVPLSLATLVAPNDAGIDSVADDYRDLTTLPQPAAS
jgi:hypothetical protein